MKIQRFLLRITQKNILLTRIAESSRDKHLTEFKYTILIKK